MKIGAIYTRKSVYSSQGESIETQIKLCTEYLCKENISHNFVYVDEGFSGKNSNRPEFKRMLEDAKEKKFHVLICYRLDRVSRSVCDFCNLIDNLQKENISFISLSEQFDSSKPIGRAMMYIASVFSQLERETIAERVKDNMLQMAKSGRWLGGMPPTGFKSISVNFLDENLQQRSFFKLCPIEAELVLVKKIYSLYLEKKSLSMVCSFLNCNKISSKLGNSFSKASVSTILQNPVYVCATEEVFDFLKSINIEALGTPDGVHGMLSYNKRNGKSGPYKEKKQWIYAIGNHYGIINSSNWLAVQKLLMTNKKRSCVN